MIKEYRYNHTMKKIMLLCAAMLALAANAQFIGVDNVAVPLYEDDSSALPIATIYQDTLIENWYRVEIIGESNSRFRVVIGSSWSVSDFELKVWIDKKNVAVCNWPTMPYDGECLYLFSKPDKNSKRQIIHADEIIDWKSQVTGVNDDWYRIIVITKAGKKEGWTKDYCPNIYGSCEHGVVY